MRKVCQELSGLSRVVTNVGSPKALVHVRSNASPSAPFAAGIPGSDPEWADIHRRRLMRASLGYELKAGSCRQPLNVALDEQSEQLPWHEEIKVSNNSLVARLSTSLSWDDKWTWKHPDFYIFL